MATEEQQTETSERFRPESGIVVDFRDNHGQVKKVYMYRDKSQGRDGFLFMPDTGHKGYSFFSNDGRLMKFLKMRCDADYGPQPSREYVNFGEEDICVSPCSPNIGPGDGIYPEEGPRTIPQLVQAVKEAYSLVHVMAEEINRGWFTMHFLRTHEDIHTLMGCKRDELPDEYNYVIRKIRSLDWIKDIFGIRLPGNVDDQLY